MTLSSVICNSSIRARRNVIIPPRYDRMNSIKRWVSLSLSLFPPPVLVLVQRASLTTRMFPRTITILHPVPPLISPSDSKRKYTTTPSTESEFSSREKREEDSSKRILAMVEEKEGDSKIPVRSYPPPSFRSTEISRRKKRDEPRIPNSTYVTCASASTAF